MIFNPWRISIFFFTCYFFSSRKKNPGKGTVFFPEKLTSCSFIWNPKFNFSLWCEKQNTSCFSYAPGKISYAVHSKSGRLLHIKYKFSHIFYPIILGIFPCILLFPGIVHIAFFNSISLFTFCRWKKQVFHSFNWFFPKSVKD